MDLSSWDREHDPTLPLNEASVLPPSTLSGEDRARTEDIWSQYRTSNHVRTTVTPTTNEDGESDFDDEARLQQRDQAINMNRSLVSCLRDNGRKILSAGYTMKQVEEELVELRNENFHLKLRIRLLEERQGLAMVRPEDKENVFRINLDLCVEKEGLKNEIEEKMKLLEDAYIALDSLEREKERDREMFEMEIEKLSSQTEVRTDRATKKQEELLLEAFGSMDLGTRPEDDEITPQNPEEELFGLPLPAKSNVLEESFGVEVTGKIRQMGVQLERVKVLEVKLLAEKDRVEQLSNENVDLRNEIDQLEDVSAQNAELNQKLEAMSTHTAELQQEVVKLDQVLKQNEELRQEIQRLDSIVADETLEIQSLKEELNSKENEIKNVRRQLVEASNDEIESLRRQLFEKESEIDELHGHVRNLKSKLNQGDEAHKESQAEAISKIAAMKPEIEALRSHLRMREDEVTELRRSLEESSAEFRVKIEQLESELASRNLDLTKTRMCVNGLAEFDSEQKEMIRNLEKDLKKRNLALAKLTEEYEIAKAKVRKYRAEKASLDNKENIDTTNSSTALFGGKNVGQILTEMQDLAKGKASLEHELRRLKEQLVANSPRSTRTAPRSPINNDEPLFEIVRREMSRVKSSCLRVGSEKALSKAKSVYSAEMQLLESTHNSVIGMMRRRLEELADFLEALLSNGLLDLSLLSTHVRDSLHRSLNESRRLSLSFAANVSMAGGDANMSLLGLGNIPEHPLSLDPNETQNETSSELMPEFRIPSISIKLTDEDLEVGDGVDQFGNGFSLDSVVSNIISAVQESNKDKFELQAQITTLQSKVSEMEQLHAAVESLKRETKSKEHELQLRELRLEQLETELQTTESGYNHAKAKCAETSSILEELRITHGQVKERLREKSKQFDLLEERLRQKSEGQKEVARLKGEVARGQARIEELQKHLKKIELHHKLEIEELSSKLAEARETEDSERDRLRREMRDKLERVIRPQLAKTHSVLKKTGVSLDKASQRTKAANDRE